MNILGIESSCDDTSMAIVTGDRQILAHATLSQTKVHVPYGGVVPEIAARAHVDALAPLFTSILKESNLTFKDIDAFAATAGPGLIGGVMVGTMAAKTLAALYEKFYIAINHLEGHALTARLTHNVPFPFLLLLVSGGHTQLLCVEDVGRYTLLGTTQDDAVGEAFDKTAKVLGLPYPGGPALEKLAQMGQPGVFTLPLPLQQDKGCSFSFSGLKTAIKRLWDAQVSPTDQTKADIAFCFQDTVTRFLSSRVSRAMDVFKERYAHPGPFVVAGGVAANKTIREAMEQIAAKNGFVFCAPPLDLCTDNGAMIAWAGVERLRRGLVSDLTFKPRPRWPLSDLLLEFR